MKPLEVDLKRLEDLSDAIVQDFAATRKREEEMRSTNGNPSIIENVFCLRIQHICFFLLFPRIDKQPCSVLQHIQYVLPVGSRHLASVVPAKILQSKETHRLSSSREYCELTTEIMWGGWKNRNRAISGYE